MNKWQMCYLWATHPNTTYSVGLELLKRSGDLATYPELAAIDGIQQDPMWHPEGDVYIHTGLVLDWAHKLCVENSITGDDRCVIIFSALCHDFGKATTTEFIDGRIRSRGHEKTGVAPATSFLQSINCPQGIIDKVLPLIANHMVTNEKLNNKAIKRLSARIKPATIQELTFLIEADQCGRHPRPKVRSETLNHLILKSQSIGIYK